jgi:hypothetical protein
MNYPALESTEIEAEHFMTDSHVPERSLQQRMSALERANEIRSYRRSLKLDIKSGHTSVIDVLLDPPKKIETMKIFDLLLSSPKMGRVKVNRILTQCRVSPSKTVGGLSERQRGELASFLRRR